MGCVMSLRDMMASELSEFLKKDLQVGWSAEKEQYGLFDMESGSFVVFAGHGYRVNDVDWTLLKSRHIVDGFFFALKRAAMETEEGLIVE